MSKVYEFLKSCEAFYVLTIDNNYPTGRPFGAIMEIDNKLYFSTGNNKNVYTQLIANGNTCIIALKQGTREWIRIYGHSIECNSLSLKHKMLDHCPVLLHRFGSANSSLFSLFEFTLTQAILYHNNDIEYLI